MFMVCPEVSISLKGFVAMLLGPSKALHSKHTVPVWMLVARSWSGTGGGRTGQGQQVEIAGPYLKVWPPMQPR